MGATPFPGHREDTDAMEKGAADADAVLHLGCVHEFHRRYDGLVGTDRSAITGLGQGLASNGKRFVGTSTTTVVAPDPDGSETNEASPLSPDPMLNTRAASEQTVSSLRQSGVKTSILRLPPFAYGQAQSVFVPIMLRSAAANGFSPYIDKPSRLGPKTPPLVLRFRALFDDL
jgi:nucleoside-diphosphate-sugar epimerase